MSVCGPKIASLVKPARTTTITEAHSPAFLLPRPVFDIFIANIVGPLPPANTFTHKLTSIDRFTRRPVATPSPDTSSTSVAKSLLQSWISVLGAPVVITIDGEPQFTSALCRELSHLPGATHIRTTTCHPDANVLVQRLHQHLTYCAACQLYK
nr:gag pol polyprotein [Hymenolepis microstoma]